MLIKSFLCCAHVVRNGKYVFAFDAFWSFFSISIHRRNISRSDEPFGARRFPSFPMSVLPVWCRPRATIEWVPARIVVGAHAKWQFERGHHVSPINSDDCVSPRARKRKKGKKKRERCARSHSRRLHFATICKCVSTHAAPEGA